jgi:hypothetical protein
MQHALLPLFLGAKPGRLSPLGWPDYSPKKTPRELFEGALADSLGTGPWATIDEMNTALKSLSPVTLLPCTLAAGDAGPHGEKLLEAWLALWHEWPPLPEGCVLIPVLAVKYDGNDSGNEAIKNALAAVNFDEIPGVLLPPFTTIRRTDVEAWIWHDQVSRFFESPASAIGCLDVIFRDTSAEIAIQPLADIHLPRFLDRL